MVCGKPRESVFHFLSFTKVGITWGSQGENERKVTPIVNKKVARKVG